MNCAMLGRQGLGALGRFQLAGVHRHPQHGVVTDRAGQLNQLLVAETLLQRIEGGGVQTVLVDEMFRQIGKSRHAHVDETTLPVIAPGKTKTSYLWSIVGGSDAPYSVYRFTSGRGRAGPLEFLARFKGILQTDAYIVYEKISGILKVIWAACWAHVRRKFVDAFKLCACTDAKHAVNIIGQLYGIERDAKPLSDEERRALRREKAAPPILTKSAAPT